MIGEERRELRLDVARPAEDRERREGRISPRRGRRRGARRRQRRPEPVRPVAGVPIAGVAPLRHVGGEGRERPGVPVPDAGKRELNHDDPSARGRVVAVHVPVFVDRLERQRLQRVVAPRQIAEPASVVPDRPKGGRALCRLRVEEHVRLIGRLIDRREAVLKDRDRFGLRLPFGLRAVRRPSEPVAGVVNRVMRVVPPPAELFRGKDFLPGIIGIPGLREPVASRQ